ncbi:glycosyltransferase family 4 protein [Streptococcus suis]|nr:glycosyltransferase family 4 protein [Streptococcus suis]MBY4969594.1 glycosyltransferase family 4 protein [Streptococcus suis]MBY4980738.1 glycosyltransferase family 4 protein [Streptococcus suis]MBY4991403.1 glycosyltransferase family 4 protein [Streptococcus suis]MBY5006846.1 glycosyltransferase family 4 protein [Streptococcus suis]
MKLAILLSDISKIGGVQRVTTALVDGLHEEVDITLISIFYENEFPAFELPDGVKVKCLFKEHFDLRKNFFKVSRCLRNIMKSSQYDAILSSGTGLVSLISYACLGIPIRKLAWEHQCFYFGKKFGMEWLGKKIACQFFDAIIVLTKKDEQFYKNQHPKAQIKQIYNIVNIHSNHLQCELSSKKIISVGSLVAQKGFDMAIEVARKLRENYPDWQWHIYGDGPDREQLQNKIKEYQLEDFMVLKGSSKNIVEIYPSYSIYAMTSRHEGLPTVLLEAKLYQLPVVAFDCNCGASDIISDGENGFLIDCYNLDNFANRLSHFMESQELREQLAKTSSISEVELSKDYIVHKWKDALKIES